MQKSAYQKLTKYVSLNVFGMLGLSCYILADTFFISNVLGSTGIAALNFSIPVFSIIIGTGLMIGIGGATRYSICIAHNEERKANSTFTTAIKFGIMIGVFFSILSIVGSEYLASLLGADGTTLPMTKTYLSTILLFAPFFIINNIVLTFVRNDNAPKLSMIAMLIGSFSNIILDFIFLYPLGMGMFGAAFATCLAPIISLTVLCMHFLRKNHQLKIIKNKIACSSLLDIMQLGTSAFITELSSAIVLITFNFAFLRLSGNLGVASYGIVANIAIVVIAIFTGIAQGIQPLVSIEYGLNHQKMLKTILGYAVVVSLVLASVIYIAVFFNANHIIAIFNKEQSPVIAQIAKDGLTIYFIGFFFAGINIIVATFFSAIEQAKMGFMISIMRGCIVIVPLVLLFSRVWNMLGIWFAFVITEAIVTLLAILMIAKKRKHDKKRPCPQDLENFCLEADL